MKLLLRLPVLLLALVAPAAASAAAPPDVPLDQGWQYRPDPHNAGLSRHWERAAGAAGWSGVQVPHVFDPQPQDNEFNGTVGWYRLRFDGPRTPAGFSWNLRFEGVRRVARVWLNGRPVGSNGNPYQAFLLPARGLKAGANELVVRVQNVRPDGLREGWWNWGGIVRPVTLVPRGRIEYQDLGILSDVDCRPTCVAIARTDGWVVNHTRKVVSPQITLRMTPPGGQEPFGKTVTVHRLRPGERRRVGFPLKVAGALRLWSPNNPNLYDAYVETRLGSDVQQVDQRRVGLRYIRVENGALYLNGHRLQLRGASIQEDMPGRGPALRPQDMDEIVANLEALGANVTRAQYPLSEALLSRLDAAGIMVWSQAPVYHEDVQLRTPAGRRNAYRKVRGTVLIDRNHPSVMTHSVANELVIEPDKTPGTAAFLRQGAAITRDLDSTVPVSVDLLSYPGIPRQESYAKFGLLGINSYYGWYKGKPGKRSTARLRDLYPYLVRTRLKYPEQALMITEFGAESTFAGPANVKETFAFQTRYVDRTLDVVDRLDWLSGAIYWTLREFYVKPNWDGGANRHVPRDALHNKGLMTYAGQPKPAFREAERRFKATPVYDDVPHEPEHDPGAARRRKLRLEQPGGR